jgi:hypothetical protein
MIEEIIMNLKSDGISVQIGEEGQILFSANSRTCVLDVKAKAAYDENDFNNSYNYEEVEEIEDVVRDILSVSR